jgi:hypothetical protein
MSYTIDGVMLTEAQAERIVEQVAERKRRPQPIPGQVYRHRKTTDSDPTGRGGYNVRKFEDGLWHYAATLTSGFYRGECAESSEGRRLWECGDLVPYIPPVITNATHAGRRVQHPSHGNGVVLRSDSANWWRNGLWEMHPPKNAVLVVAYDSGNVEGAPAYRFTLLD